MPSVGLLGQTPRWFDYTPPPPGADVFYMPTFRHRRRCIVLPWLIAAATGALWCV